MGTLNGPGTHLSSDRGLLGTIYTSPLRGAWLLIAALRRSLKTMQQLPYQHLAAKSRAASTPKCIANILMKDMCSLQLKWIGECEDAHKPRLTQDLKAREPLEANAVQRTWMVSFTFSGWPYMSHLLQFPLAASLLFTSLIHFWFHQLLITLAHSRLCVSHQTSPSAMVVSSCFCCWCYFCSGVVWSAESGKIWLAKPEFHLNAWWRDTLWAMDWPCWSASHVSWHCPLLWVLWMGNFFSK